MIHAAPLLPSLVAALAVSSVVSTASATEPDNFYADREVSLIVGTGAGGGYDTFARLVARFVGKHIPGNPTFVVQTMPGASGIKAVNYLYSVAPKDGSVIATFNDNMPVYQLIGQPGIQFKCEELSWIGSVSNDLTVLVAWHTADVRTIQDVTQKQLVLGATGAGGMKAGLPAFLNRSLGTRFKIVTGYEGGNSVTLAMERGEVDSTVTSWGSFVSIHPDWISDRKIVPLVQVSLEKAPALGDVPRLTDLARNDEEYQIYYLLSAVNDIARPYAAPPGIPRGRLEILRKGFDDLERDADFLAAAAKQNLTIVPRSGEQVREIVTKITSTPPVIVAKSRQALAGSE